MEWVGDTGGMIEAWRQPGAQRLGQIRRNHLDAGEPGGVGVRGPFPQVNGCVALDHVDHLVAFQVDEAGHLVAFQVDEAGHLVAFQVDEVDHLVAFQVDEAGHLVAFQVDEAGHLVAFQVDEAGHLVAFQVDEAGRVDRVVMSVRAQKRRLIHPQLAHPTDPGRVVDERSAVLNNGVHDRLPTHTELVCDLRHRSRQLTNPAARLSTGASSENDLGIEELERFGPRLGRTQQLPTPPSSLPDPQPGRPAEAFQIADINPHPILRLGPAPTPLAPRSRSGRLDLDRHLTVRLGHIGHAHTIKSEHRLSKATTVHHRRDLLTVEVVEQLQRWRDPCTRTQTLTPSPLPTSTRRADNVLQGYCDFLNYRYEASTRAGADIGQQAALVGWLEAGRPGFRPEPEASPTE